MKYKIICFVVLVAMLICAYSVVISADYTYSESENSTSDLANYTWVNRTPIYMFGYGDSNSSNINSIVSASTEPFYPMVEPIPNYITGFPIHDRITSISTNSDTVVYVGGATSIPVSDEYYFIESDGTAKRTYNRYSAVMTNENYYTDIYLRVGDFFVPNTISQLNKFGNKYGQLAIISNNIATADRNQTVTVNIAYEWLVRVEGEEDKITYRRWYERNTAEVLPTFEIGDGFQKLTYDIEDVIRVAVQTAENDNAIACKIVDIYFELSPINETNAIVYTGESDYLDADTNIISSYSYEYITTQQQNSQYLPQLDAVGNMLGTAVDGFLDVEIMPYVTIGMIFTALLAIALLVVFLKVFAGG